MSDRIITYAEGQDLDVSNLVDSGFTHVILAFIHVATDGLVQSFGLGDPDSEGYYLAYNGTQLASYDDYSQYVGDLDQGTLPSGLGSEIDSSLEADGYPALSSQAQVSNPRKGALTPRSR